MYQIIPQNRIKMSCESISTKNEKVLSILSEKDILVKEIISKQSMKDHLLENHMQITTATFEGIELDTVNDVFKEPFTIIKKTLLSELIDAQNNLEICQQKKKEIQDQISIIEVDLATKEIAYSIVKKNVASSFVLSIHPIEERAEKVLLLQNVLNPIHKNNIIIPRQQRSIKIISIVPTVKTMDT